MCVHGFKLFARRLGNWRAIVSVVVMCTCVHFHVNQQLRLYYWFFFHSFCSYARLLPLGFSQWYCSSHLVNANTSMRFNLNWFGFEYIAPYITANTNIYGVVHLCTWPHTHNKLKSVRFWKCVCVVGLHLIWFGVIKSELRAWQVRTVYQKMPICYWTFVYIGRIYINKVSAVILFWCRVFFTWVCGQKKKEKPNSGYNQNDGLFSGI